MVAGGLGLLYLMMPSRGLFFLIATLTAIFAFAIVFVKIGGRPFGTVFQNFLRYSFGSKLYLWQRKAAPPRLLKKTKLPETKKEEEGGPALKIVEKSRLKEMTKRIETGFLEG